MYRLLLSVLHLFLVPSVLLPRFRSLGERCDVVAGKSVLLEGVFALGQLVVDLPGS